MFLYGIDPSIGFDRVVLIESEIESSEHEAFICIDIISFLPSEDIGTCSNYVPLKPRLFSYKIPTSDTIHLFHSLPCS